MSHPWLTWLAGLALSACGLGLMFKLIRLLRLGWPRHIAAAHTIIDAPEPLPWPTAFRRMLLSPFLHFHRRSSRGWTTGYVFYHTAIIMVVSGYAVSGFIILTKLIRHAPMLDFTSGALIMESTLANALAVIFGNTEQLPSNFLFGSWAPGFRALAWCELPLAVIGNICLLYALFHRRLGAVRHDLDPAVQNLRLRGAFSGQHLLVRSIIFSIITLEFIGHFDWIPGIAYAHAGLGMLLIALFPFTYLVHIPLAPLALGLAILRRRRHAIA